MGFLGFVKRSPVNPVPICVLELAVESLSLGLERGVLVSRSRELQMAAQ